MQLTDGHVMTCQAEECSYNQEERCMAARIVIGSRHPECEMFTTETVERTRVEPRVAQCDIADCTFNADASCGAAGITLDRHAGHADCVTYRH